MAILYTQSHRYITRKYEIQFYILSYSFWVLHLCVPDITFWSNKNYSVINFEDDFCYLLGN